MYAMSVINAGNCQRPARCNVLVAKASRGVGVGVEHSTSPDTICRPFRGRSSSQNYPASEPIILISLDHETRWTVRPSVCLYMSNLRFTLLGPYCGNSAVNATITAVLPSFPLLYYAVLYTTEQFWQLFPDQITAQM